MIFSFDRRQRLSLCEPRSPSATQATRSHAASARSARRSGHYGRSGYSHGVGTGRCRGVAGLGLRALASCAGNARCRQGLQRSGPIPRARPHHLLGRSMHGCGGALGTRQPHAAALQRQHRGWLLGADAAQALAATAGTGLANHSVPPRGWGPPQTPHEASRQIVPAHDLWYSSPDVRRTPVFPCEAATCTSRKCTA